MVGARGRSVFLKLAGAGKDGVPFPHSSFFKTLKFFLFYYFFTKYHFSSHFFPYSTGVAHPQARLGLGRVGRGTCPRKCRT